MKKNYKYLLLTITIIISAIVSTPLLSQDYPNSVNFEMGVGTNVDDAKTKFNIMVGYDRHIEGSANFSVGLFVGGSFGNRSYAVLGLPVAFYPVEAVKLWIAPCYTFGGRYKDREYKTDDGKDYWTEDDGVDYFKVHNDFMLKFGFGYNIKFQQTRFALLPYIEGSVMQSDFLLGIGVKLEYGF
ncbi:MAG: hypothetical protein LBO69_06935 [Ignavibacteria bacterium]|jgi:hypothetical protein|nr:hypothetical protein [Ignavibacteria bacterium]